MRRICALVLVAIFSLQTTASAASPIRVQTPNLQPLLSAIEGSHIFALLTGHESRYEAINAPAPSPAPKHTPMAVHPAVINYHAEARVLMSGNARIVAGEPKHPMYPWQFQAQSGSAQPSAKRTRAATPLPRATPAVRMAAARATMRPMVVPTATPSAPPTTGINRWWDYEEGLVPGVGKYMVNVGTGNLLVQANDVDIPERGIDLAFRRTYNSQSLHDAANDDGSVQSNFGDGWTNTFDAHLGASGGTTSGVANVVSVYDIDGARYDYTLLSVGSGGSASYTPPAGMQGTSLNFDGSCGFYWTKKTGTQYAFYAPFATGCNTTSDTGSFGRIIYIFGRNANNYVHFVYSWNGNDSSSDNLSSIAVKHSDGQSLTLEFAKFSGSSHAELAHVVRPDGDTVDFYYDTTTGTHLTEVDQPGHGTGGLYSQYAYYGSSDQLYYVCSPRYVAAVQAGTNDGGCSLFSFASTDINGVTDNNVTTGAWNWVWANFAPSDGTGTSLQQNLNNGYYYVDSRTFTYSSAPSSNSTWETWMTDTDGHSTQYFVDTFGRLTQRDDYVGSSQATWLIRTNTWDANNDLTSTVDPRGFGLSGSPNPYETDYAYDANGNTIAVALPSVTTNDGALRPTSTYSYDAYNNLLSYCDPVYNAPNSWYNPANTPPTCPTSGIGDGYTVYTWNETDANEPFGYLTDTYTPLGYHRAVAYNTSSEGGDFGLPTSVTGAPYRQNDNTVRTPTQTFTYDSFGDLATYNKGNGAWTLTYDVLNRLSERTDPDNVSSYTCYNADDTVSLRRSASQYAADSSESCAGVTPATSAGVSYTYDADENTSTEQHHYGCATLSSCTAGVTTKWYDGFDRLVEVKQAQDPSDAYAFAWMTRYIYDISQGQPQSISGGATNFLAYGNLYKTQECLSSTSVTVSNSSTQLPSCTFQDLRGNTFDALDRSLAKYEVAAGTTPETTSTYDGNSELGFLSQKRNAMGQADTLSYDADGHLTEESFSDSTPMRRFIDDPDGRQVSLTSATLGTQTRGYDADGRLIATTDPTNQTDPGAIAYNYYGDGLRKSLGLSIPTQSFNQASLFQYSYRPDGARSSLVSSIGSGSNTFAWTYTNAGRELTQTDPLTGEMTAAGSALVAKSSAYDSFGQLSSLTLPRSFNSFTSLTHDLEGNITYDAYYTRRDEAYGGTYVALFADGAQCAWSPLTSSVNSCTIDARSGALLGSYVSGSGTQQTPPDPYTATHTYAYDAAGRQVTDNAVTCVGTGTATRTYDADDHIVQQMDASGYMVGRPNCGTAQYGRIDSPTYQWAADGHLASSVAPVAGYSMSAHWDGSDLLYSVENTSTQNNLYIYIEKLGVFNATYGTEVYDRDWSGASADFHLTDGTPAAPANFTALNPDLFDPFHKNCPADNCVQSQTPANGGASASNVNPMWAPLDASRLDGYYDRINVFQGVRAYDPYMSQWTTPDAYAGNVDDPMSQEPYMWNGNNPIEFSDPSGYCPENPTSQQLASDPSCTIITVHSHPSGQTTQEQLSGIPENPMQFIAAAIGGPEDEAADTAAEEFSEAAAKAAGESDAWQLLKRQAGKVLQTGGNTLRQSTVRALGLTRQEAHEATEALKKYNLLPPNYHFTKIMASGDVFDSETGEWYGNLYDFLPGGRP